MNQRPGNPAANNLPQNITAQDVLGVVASSGYPLQTAVAKQLLDHFAVVEEWGYIDRASKEHRSLDIYAYRSLVRNGPAHLHPELVLLIECKRADVPFVFFEASVSKVPRDFPSIFGFRNRSFSLQSGKGTRDVSPAEFLRTVDFPFIGVGAPVCNSIASVERPGKLQLSGETSFRSIMMPLVNAVDHWEQMRPPAGQQAIYHPSLTLTICVLDAAMILASGTPETPILTLSPWIRVLRQEAQREHSSRRYRHYVVDFVHRAFLAAFIGEHVLPFAASLAGRLREREALILHGTGTVPDWENWTWEQLKHSG